MLTYTFIVLAVIFFVLWRKKSFSRLQELGIPGPEPNILFGNVLEIVSKNPLQCNKEWIEKYGKVMGYYFGSKPVVVVADVELLKKIQVSDFHNYMNRPNILRGRDRKPGKTRRIEGFSQQLISLTDKRWKEIRSILTPSFTASKMKQMVPILDGTIESLLKNVETKSLAGESFDIYPMYQALTMDAIGRTAFGIQTDVQNDPNDPFLRSARLLLSGDIGSIITIIAVSFRSLDRLWSYVNRIRLMWKNHGTSPVRELIESTKNVIAVRRKDKESRRPDLLQLMMDAKVEAESSLSSDDLTAKDDNEVNEKAAATSSGKLTRQMTNDDILDNSVLFFLAGYETTSTALAFITNLLVQHPEVQEKVAEEVEQLLKTEGELDYNVVNKLQYLDQVVHEGLRLYPPIYRFVNRECGADSQLGNFRIPKGTAIQVPVYYLHRNPELWQDPDEFKPERFAPENKGKYHPMAFQPFGAGPRNCIGMRFALMEAKLTLAKLLSKYKLKACAESEKEPITLKISVASIKPKKGVYLKAIPR